MYILVTVKKQAMIKIKPFVFNPFQENTFVLYDETGEAVIIDPGCYSEGEKNELVKFIREKGLKPVHLLNTHCHVDHVLGNQFVSEYYGLVPAAHKSDVFLAESAHIQGINYGFQLEPVPAIGNYLEEGMQVQFGHSILDILHIPGHSPGGLVFYNKAEGFMIVGDVLFSGSIGRSDLPGGNHRQLVSAIEKKLFVLGDSMKVYPGHGPSTTIGNEKATNPFFN
jgi:hydroxyacylglutathione hydrolase